jgi:hypothetical protein
MNNVKKDFLYAWEINNNLKKINEGEIEIIAYSNKSNYYFPILLESSNKYNYPLKILGWNEEWKGFGTKLFKCYEYFKSLKNTENKYALIIDAWDVFLTRDYNDLILETRSFNYDIIFSSSVVTEKNMKSKSKRYVINTFASLLFGSKELKDLLNAGVLLIKINVFIEIFEKYKPNEYTDDQMMYIQMLNETSYNYIIDHNNYFFLTLNPCYGNDISLERIKNKDIMPFTIHAPSSSSLDNFIIYYFNKGRFNNIELSQSKLNSMRPIKSIEIGNKFFYYFKGILYNNTLTIILLIISILLNIKKIFNYFINYIKIKNISN